MNKIKIIVFKGDVYCSHPADVTYINDIHRAKTAEQLYAQVEREEAETFEDEEQQIGEFIKEDLKRVTAERWILHARIDTVHKYRSLCFFGAPKESGINGYEVRQEFPSKDHAIDYLKHRIDLYCAENGTIDECAAMLMDAENGSVTYDGITCNVFTP
jgi:hypothetical protein